MFGAEITNVGVLALGVEIGIVQFLARQIKCFGVTRFSFHQTVSQHIACYLWVRR